MIKRNVVKKQKVKKKKEKKSYNDIIDEYAPINVPGLLLQ